MVKASIPRVEFRKLPTTVQLPIEAQDTALKLPSVACMPVANTADFGCAHTPFVEVIVNASVPPALFRKTPTAVQFPGDAHETASG